MYVVGNAFKEYIYSRTRRAPEYTGTITLTDGAVYTFSNADISESGGTLTRKCSSESSIDIGGVYASELVLSLIPNEQTLNVDRYRLYEAVIDIYCVMPGGAISTWGDATAFTWNDVSMFKWGDNPKIPKANIPLGKYIVSEAMRSYNAIKITAYDYMTKFNKDLAPLDDVSRTIFEWLRMICNDCGVTLGMNVTQVRALTNGDRTPKYANVRDDVKTYRDLLFYITQSVAAVALINRAGQLVLKQYSMTVDDTVDSSFRFSSDFSDYLSYYTGLRASYRPEALSEYYTNNSEADDGLSYNIGLNPFLQISNADNRGKVLQGIIDAQKNIRYSPFKVETPCNPLYDPMDILEFTDNQAGEEDIAPITSIVYRFGRSMEIACKGADPALADVGTKETRTDESIAAGDNSYVSGDMMWMSIGSGPSGQLTIAKDVLTELSSIKFNALKDKNQIQVAFTAAYSLSVTSLVKTYVYIDNTQIYMTETNQWIGKNQLTVTTGYELDSKGSHTVKVKMEITDSTLDIGGGGVLAERSVTANGLYVAADDGVYGYSKVTALIDDSMGYYARASEVELETEDDTSTYDLIDDYEAIFDAGRLDVSSTTDIDAFGDSIYVYNAVGVTITSSSVSYGVAEINGYEESEGYEGFCVMMSNLTQGETYVVTFDYQTVSGSFITGHNYILGFVVHTYYYNSYPTYSENSGIADGWVVFEYDLNKHSYSMPFIATNAIMYLDFCMAGYSNTGQNVFEITNLKVSKID